MGVQTFDDERLRFIRRRHSSRQAVKAVYSLVENGIDNVSIDLILAFPMSLLSLGKRFEAGIVLARQAFVGIFFNV